MTAWTPPADTSLSSAGINHVVAGLRDPASRDTTSAFLDDITDPGLLHVIACEISTRHDQPNLGATADGLRAFIRNRV
ncbi:hypothetical protein ACQP2Y_21050 [Actinoplanes sp. CA-051413]|uniref:hypothetical protein n=1 Tax=Actinoplanes sp. CA-051413 TaxID=3239899 RepID=UPI003D98C29D